MPLIRESPDRFASRVSAAATSRGLDPALVEKDYWAVQTLRAVANGIEIPIGKEQVRIQPIFKGGTSLSKAFGLIERFSEDVDLLIPVPLDSPNGYSQSQRSNVMKACPEAVGTALGIPGELSRARKGADRHWRYPYTPVAGDPALVGVEPMVRVELSVIGGAHPHSPRRITSMVPDLAATIDGFPAYDDLAVVEIDTLAAERTLVEKLAMLHDAAAQALDGSPERLTRAGRHFYDVAQLLDSADVRATLNLGGIAADADRWSDKGNFPFTPRPDAGSRQARRSRIRISLRWPRRASTWP
jgi:hypothetical protein